MLDTKEKREIGREKPCKKQKGKNWTLPHGTYGSEVKEAGPEARHGKFTL